MFTLSKRIELGYVRFHPILSFIFISLIGLARVLISLLLGDKLNSEKLNFGVESGLNWSKFYGKESSRHTHYIDLSSFADLNL